MRSIGSSLVLAAVLGVVGCSAPASQSDGPVLSRGQAIQGGTVDMGDNAVVGIVINAGGGIAICSGSLIAPNLVLTAHHCVGSSGSTNCSSSSFGSNYAASSFRVTTSYNKAANSFNTGSIPTVDGSTWFGVAKVLTPGNNICGQDMAVLELSKPITGVCPLIPAVDAPVKSGDSYTAIGFGITSPSGMAAGTRYKVSGLTVQCTSASSCGESTSQMSNTMEWEGGSSGGKGTCEGDSGGPSIDSAGRVIGTVSRGPSGSCSSTIYESVYGEAAWIKSVAQTAASDGGYTAAGWVTGGATSDPNNGYCPGGTPTDAGSGGGGGADTGTSGGGGGGGGTTCPSPTQCIDGSGMGNYGCFDPSTSDGFPASAPSCTSDTDCPSGWNCWAASATATSGSCIQPCTPDSSSDAGTGGSTDSGSGGGGGADSGGGTGGGADAGTPGTPGTPAAEDGGTADTGIKHKLPVNDDTGSSGSCTVANAGSSSDSSSALAGLFALAASFFVARRRR